MSVLPYAELYLGFFASTKMLEWDTEDKWNS